MFCSKCGSEIPEGKKFCEKCGKSSGIVTTNDSNESQSDRSNNQQEFVNVFIEPDEHLLGKLGNGYMVNMLFNRTKKCHALLTDKRVYLKGAFYHGNSHRLFKTIEEQILDLEDITRTGFVYHQLSMMEIFIRIFIIMLGVVVLFSPLFISFFIEDGYFMFTPLFSLYIIIFIIINVLLFFVRYIMSRKILFCIDCAGGSIKIDAKLIGLSDVQDFHKQMRRAKDALTGKK